MRRVSIVVPTFDRRTLLVRLLKELDHQSADPQSYEVIVVDDGSEPPVAGAVQRLEVGYRLEVVRQENAGAAAARDRGARLASGELLVFLDDDMEVRPGFVEAHRRAHGDANDLVVLGRMRPHPSLERMPLFERFHAAELARFEAEAKTGAPISPLRLSTGNVSMPRALFLEAGGFDESLMRSEDRELGIRLGKLGARFVFADDADTVHASDHTSLDVWLDRAYRYGRYDLVIANKHPEVIEADPFGFLFLVSRISRPILLLSATAPETAKRVALAAMSAAEILDRLHLERPAVAGTTLAYGIAYFGGVGAEEGSLRATARGLARHLRRRRRPRGGRRLAAARWLVDALRMDAAVAGAIGDAPRASDMLATVRVMQALHRAGLDGPSQALSRLVRHAFGAEVHWESALEPGLVVDHGQGLTVSLHARVGRGSHLSHHVTLGEAVDPRTRERGAPTLEEDVWVGPGATLLGPIVVGRGSRVGAGVVLDHSVPAGTELLAPAPSVGARSTRRDVQRPRINGEVRDG